MPRIRYEQQAKDTAFHVWRTNGQNVVETLRILKNEHGFKHLARPTLYKWMQEYKWHARAARIEVQERQDQEAQLVGRERILTDLVTRKKHLDRYFAGLSDDEVDNQSLTSYLNLSRMILQVQQQLDKDRGDLGDDESGAGLASLVGA